MLKTLGVDGHCTNYPTEFTQWLKNEEKFEARIKNIVNSGKPNGGQYAY
jgi:hypothetical protein